MPKLIFRNPKYQKHRASGQAVVRLDGKDFYLGPHGTKASRDEYDRLIAEWLAGGRRLAPASTAAGPADLTVSELILRFWGHAERYYRKPDGSPSSELSVFRDALRPLRRLYGSTRARDFGPLSLKALGEEMIRLGWARTNINKQLGRVKHVFKWAVANELLPPSVHQGLLAVSGLRAGRTDAREPEPVRAVPEAAVLAVLPHASSTVATMIRLQLLTGARPGEICAMRAVDIDRVTSPWLYRPASHKTQHHGHERYVFLPPDAQALLSPLLEQEGRDPAAYLFRPVDSAAERRAARAATRRTPVGQGNGPGSVHTHNPKRRPGLRFTVAAYRRAIARAAELAFGMPPDLAPAQGDTPDREREKAVARRAWHTAHVPSPHQLRHTAATRIRKAHGLEAAQVILGHKTLTVTQVYAERDVERARRVMSDNAGSAVAE